MAPAAIARRVSVTTAQGQSSNASLGQWASTCGSAMRRACRVFGKRSLGRTNRKMDGIVLWDSWRQTAIREYIDAEDKLSAVIEYMNKRLAFDGYELRQIGQAYKLVSTGTNTVAAAALSDKARLLDLSSVEADFNRAVAAADRDPEDAITSACSTVESVCKCILDKLGQPYPVKEDISHLSQDVAKHLGLSPARTDLPALLAGDLKHILGGLQSVASGIGSLRTHFGDAHGRGTGRTPVDARIARLAIHAASTLSLFYIETWQRTHVTRSE